MSAFVWRPGIVVSALASINEVNQQQAWLLLRWVTVSGFTSQCGTFISVCGQPPRSTQPGHPFVGRCNEYQPKGGDALWLGSKDKYGSCVGGRHMTSFKHNFKNWASHIFKHKKYKYDLSNLVVCTANEY